MTEMWESVLLRRRINSLLESIAKAESEMHNVKSKEFENALKPAMQ